MPDAGTVIAAIAVLLTVAGGFIGLWFRVTGMISNETKSRSIDKREIYAAVEAEKQKNAEQETKIRLLELDLSNTKEGVGTKIDGLSGKVEKLTDKLEHHMETEGRTTEEIMRRVVSEEFRRFAGRQEKS